MSVSPTQPANDPIYAATTSQSKIKEKGSTPKIKVVVFAPTGEVSEKIKAVMLNNGASFTLSHPGKARCYDIKKGESSESEEYKIYAYIFLDQFRKIVENSRSEHSYIEMGYDAMPLQYIASNL